MGKLSRSCLTIVDWVGLFPTYNLCNNRDNYIQKETWMKSKAKMKDGEENLALFDHSNKGRGNGPNKGKGKSEESTSQLRKRDLSKIKCFSCHKHNHYASQCLDKKKGKGKQHQKQLATFA
jgi:hypothetical protein